MAAAAAGPSVTATIPVGRTPSGVVVSPNGSVVYVTNSGSNTVSVIDAATSAVTATIAVGTRPSAVAVSSNGGRVYVTNVGTNSVSVIDTASNTVVGGPIAVGVSPSSVVVSPDGSRLYVVNAGGNTVSVINTATNTVISTIAVGLAPSAAVISPNGKRVYVANWERATGSEGSVSVIDTATNVVIGTTTVGVQPTGLAINPNGSRVYAVNYGNSVVSVINTATNGVIASPNVGTAPWSVAVSPDGKTAYVTNRFDYTVSVIDTVTNKVRGAAIPTGPLPTAVAVSPDGTRVYVTNVYGNTVSVINTTAASVSVGVPDSTTGVVTGVVSVVNPNNAKLVFKVSGPGKGTVSINSAGVFTYTPKAAARHAASATTAAVSAKADTFTVTVTGGPNGTIKLPVTVTVGPKNADPTATVKVGTPDAASGTVTGTIGASDADKDAFTYTSTPVSHGTLTISAKGVFTYAPYVAAQFASGASGANAADKTEFFRVAVADGHGGNAIVDVNVAIAPLGAASSAEGLIYKIPSTTDTIYAEKVVDDKNKRRMVVYMSGIQVGVNQSTLDSTFSNAGLLQKDVQAYIDQAYVKFGKPSEIELVGHSNGGQQMQAYAAAGTYRDMVTSVVVFASPLTKIKTDFKADALAFINHNDPVPALFTRLGVKWDKSPKITSWSESESAILGVYRLDIKYHDATAYRALAKAFDAQAKSSKDAGIKKLRDDIGRFRGTVKETMTPLVLPKL